MGKKLAIKGHPTRGKEVIELLEMLGGKNCYNFSGFDGYAYYVIAGCQNKIKAGEYIFGDEDVYFFTLEEFLEKYPFKVGDKVKDLKTDKIAEVYKIHWSKNNSCVYYDIKYLNNLGCQRKLMDLQPYEKEINMEESTTLNMSAIDYNNGLVGYEIPEGYEFDTVIDNKIILKLIKPKYPKSYGECCDIIDYDPCEDEINCYKGGFIESFVRLLICRDAYWKIAGKQMGLDKPWEPDWKDNYQKKWTISLYQGEINLTNGPNIHRILAFPTEEMQDTFYENFKDLIEQCKELL